jgi:hypothetical protein
MTHTESHADTFTAEEIRLLHQAVRDYVVRGVIGNRSLPDGYGPLSAKLTSSVRGTKTCAAQPQSPPSTAEELIDSIEAAAILRYSDRWVRDPRFRDRIGGREVCGRWLFPRQTVVAYAERKAGQRK